MRPQVSRLRSGWIVACAIVLTLTVAAPAAAITNLYAPGTIFGQGFVPLVDNYAVAPDGAVTPLAPTDLGNAPQDIAITPDGRFAYITLAGESNTIAQMVRGADGRLAPNPAGATVASGTDPVGILVNPQGTRVYYANTGSVDWRAVNADGTLGTPVSIPLAGARPEFLAMTPDGTSLYVADSSARAAKIFQFSVDPATGTVASKTPAVVAWPTATGAVTPFAVARMTVAPDGGVLYATAQTVDAGIARFSIAPSTGVLGGGTVEGAVGDEYGEGSVAIAPSGSFLWAPSDVQGGISPSFTARIILGGRVNQFAIGGGGALAPLVPAFQTYAVDSPTREAVASPDGRSLYLGQDGTISTWAIAAGGTLTHRANTGPTGAVGAGLVMTPSQAPVAAFSAVPAPAGQATAFDAGASADPDGSIARYDWDFGDGSKLPDGGPKPTHVYASAGDAVVTLTVTDADGTATAKLWTGARMLRNGGPSARTTSLASIPPATTIAVPPLLEPPPPRPRRGRSVTVSVERGTILVRVPTSGKYVPLEELTEIPLGSIIDARRGRVRITSEVDPTTGKTQSAVFYEWFFKVLQTKGSKPITEARLVKGSFGGCEPGVRSTSAALTARSAGVVARAAKSKGKRSKRTVRRLWGSGKGSFRTGGQRSSATVRGTTWLVEDRCDGTLTRVKVGRVHVRDFRLKKTFKLRPGRVYLAKAP